MRNLWHRSLYAGILLALPFFVANALVATQSEWFLSVLRPLGETSGYEQVLVLVLVALVFVGGVLTLVPAIAHRRVYLLNIILGMGLVLFALVAGYGLGLDFYRCDILQIPNCD